jgi:uncharacterized protein YabE (DUF348 family)
MRIEPRFSTGQDDVVECGEEGTVPRATRTMTLNGVEVARPGEEVLKEDDTEERRARSTV